MIKFFSNLGDLNIFAAEKFIACGGSAIKENGKFSVALAGGSTPKALYRLLTTEEFKNRIDWRRVFFFFGDERNVLPDDDESNFRMANESILKPLEIQPENIFRWQTELGDAEKTAEDYERKIKEFFDLSEKEFPRFDLILLGMGDDGHTASLFPFSPALRETEKIAAANFVEKFDANRLTFTFPSIDNAANVVFLIGGAAKANVLKEILEGEAQPEKFPAQNVKPQNGNLLWLVDADAGRLLARETV